MSGFLVIFLIFHCFLVFCIGELDVVVCFVLFYIGCFELLCFALSIVGVVVVVCINFAYIFIF